MLVQNSALRLAADRMGHWLRTRAPPPPSPTPAAAAAAATRGEGRRQSDSERDSERDSDAAILAATEAAAHFLEAVVTWPWVTRLYCRPVCIYPSIYSFI